MNANERKLREAPDRLWQEWLEWAQTQDRTVPLSADFEAIRARVWEASEYVAQGAARYPGDFADLLDSGDLARPYAPGDLAARLVAALSVALPGVPDEPRLHRALRVARRREQTRIIWRDLGGLAGLDETLEDLSELADCCIRVSLDRLHAWTRAELGTPCDAQGREQHLLVIGMGKLGARELNLSSDIDLIFAFPTQGQVTGGPRPLDNQQFFVRLAQRLVQALNAQTTDGFVFRVDTRLRPFGDSGPLVMSLDALEDYYQSQAREWERYAMIKARVLAGEAADRAALTDLLRPFVYRRYLDFGSIESLREMKQMIAKELHNKGMDANIKLGPGGIREIEFIAQVFQLIRGGREIPLQTRSTLTALEVLAARGFRVVPIANADTGLELSQRLRFDAAFCSVHAPGLNWVELSERMQSRVEAFVLLSDRYDAELSADFEGDGRFVLSKPLQDSELEHVLRALEPQSPATVIPINKSGAA